MMPRRLVVKAGSDISQTRRIAPESRCRPKNVNPRRFLSLAAKRSRGDPKKHMGKKVDVRDIADRLNIRLTDAEFARLRRMVDTNRDGVVSRLELNQASQRAMEDRSTRELCLSVIEQPGSWWDRLLGKYALGFLDVAGTILYAVAGTQVAGDKGMNVVGCTLVGCATALGGGTLNNLLYGTSSPLHSQPGVFWVRTPSYLAMALGASLATFFLWPYYCSQQADHYLKYVIGSHRLEKDGSVGRAAFVRACRQNQEFLDTMRVVAGKKGQNKSAEDIFTLLDHDKSGTLERNELRQLTQNQFDNSFETYVLDSFALASFAVAAAHSGISAGVHPIVAASAGVTICFGGIVRDVLCGRPIAIGAQSYAFATGSGAAVYVALRELCVRGLYTSLFTRILLTASTTIGLRYWEYERGLPLLAPMHGRPTDLPSS